MAEILLVPSVASSGKSVVEQPDVGRDNLDQFSPRHFVFDQKIVCQRDTLTEAGSFECEVGVPKTGAGEALRRSNAASDKPGTPLFVILFVN
jgi:hypothetical protein